MYWNVAFDKTYIAPTCITDNSCWSLSAQIFAPIYVWGYEALSYTIRETNIPEEKLHW